MDELLSTKWKSTKVGTPPLEGEKLASFQSKLGYDWNVKEGKVLVKEFKFPNFVKGLEFTNKIGDFAEEKNHHPDIHLAWGKVVIEIWTHRIGGLAEMDFVWAANAEKIFQDQVST